MTTLLTARRLETFFVVYAIIVTTSAFYFLFGSAPETGTAAAAESSAATNPILILLRVGLWLWAGMIVLQATLRDGLRWPLIFVLPFIVYIFLTSFWSVSHTRTLYFASLLTANVLVAYAVALAVTPDRFLRILTATLAALLILSFVFFFVFPEISYSDRWGGGWIAGIQLNGVYSHKSSAGIFFGSLLIILWLTNMTSHTVRLFLTALGVLGLLLTNSATGVAGTVILIVAFLMARALRMPTRYIVPAVGIALFAFASILPFISLGDAAEVVGRDGTLTGRSWIWAAGVRFFLERPLLGYGYYGFFHPGEFSPVWQLWNIDAYFQTPHFHNATIDVAISLGFVGLFLYGVTLIISYGIIGNTTVSLPAREAIAAVLSMMVLSTAFDLTIMAHNTFGTLLMFYCFFASQFTYGPDVAEALDMDSEPGDMVNGNRRMSA